MASGSMLKYIQTSNSELNMIEGNEDENVDEPREIPEQQTIEKKDKFTIILRKYPKINPDVIFVTKI